MVDGIRPLLKSDASTPGRVPQKDPRALATNHITFCFRVPKELISRFVKICPTCQVRRGGSRLTPPSSRRSSPRLDRVSRSPKLPSPPISRRESTFGQVSLDRTQSDYFGQLHGHGWVDSHQSLQGRSTLSPGIRPAHGPMGSLTHSMTGSLDHFGELSVPGSQLSYTTGYGPSYGPPPQREY